MERKREIQSDPVQEFGWTNMNQNKIRNSFVRENPTAQAEGKLWRQFDCFIILI